MVFKSCNIGTSEPLASPSLNTFFDGSDESERLFYSTLRSKVGIQIGRRLPRDEIDDVISSIVVVIVESLMQGKVRDQDKFDRFVWTLRANIDETLFSR